MVFSLGLSCCSKVPSLYVWTNDLSLKPQVSTVSLGTKEKSSIRNIFQYESTDIHSDPPRALSFPLSDACRPAGAISRTSRGQNWNPSIPAASNYAFKCLRASKKHCWRVSVQINLIQSTVAVLSTSSLISYILIGFASVDQNNTRAII